MDQIIQPLKQFNRVLAAPPDKSVTHRAILFSALSDGQAVIYNALLGADCVSSIECVRALGARVDTDGNTVTVRGTFDPASAALYAGNSGTTMRLLAGLLAGAGVNAFITGDESLSARPMRRVTEPLRAMGADISDTGGRAPLVIRPAKLRGIDFENVTGSAQVKSAVLLAGLNADGVTTVRESAASRSHTEIMLGAMNAKIHTASVPDGFLTTVSKSANMNAKIRLTVMPDTETKK